VADAHQDASRGDQGGRRETELLGSQQRRDDDIASGLQLTIALHHNAVAQAIEQQGLLGLGQAELPRAARMLDRGQRSRTGTTVVAGDQHHIGLRLADAGGDRAHTDLGDQLDVHPSRRIGALEVVDQLLEILDRVDVVMRRRADQADARCRMPGPRDPWVHLRAGQLTALARLGTLRHLDLQISGIAQVLRGHAEATGGHLLDRGAALRIVQPLGILATLTGVRASAQPVHRDGERLVSLQADRAVTHRAGAEPLHDGRDRLDLIDIDRRGSGLQLQQGTQRHEPRRPVVDPRGVALEHVIASGPGGVLQAEDAFRIEQMLFALATPLVLATGDQGAVRQRIGRRVGVAVMLGDIVSQFVQADALDPRTRAGEELRHELTVEADGLEDLRAAVGRHRGHAHLAHHLEQAVLERTDHVVNGLFRWHRHQQLAASQIFGALEKQVRVDRRRAVADQQGKMMHLPHITGLDDHADIGAHLQPHQVVMHVRRGQQGRNRSPRIVGMPVAEHDVQRAVLDGRGDLVTHLGQAITQRLGAAGGIVEAGDDPGQPVRVVGALGQVNDLRQLLRVDHRGADDQLVGRFGPRRQQIALRTGAHLERGDQFLADGVQRRVGDLSEELAEVVEQRARLVRQHRQRSVGAHRADRFGARVGHRRDDHGELFVRVAEDLLAARHRTRTVHDVGTLGQIVQEDPALLQPFTVGVLGSQLVLDLLIVDQPVAGQVDQQHPARRQASLLANLCGRHIEHAGFGREDHPVVGHPVAGRTKPVAVQRRPDQGAVGEADTCRAVPRLHQAGVVVEEVAVSLREVVVVLPRFGHHHHHGMRQRASAQMQQLQHLIEGRRVGITGLTDREEPV